MATNKIIEHSNNGRIWIFVELPRDARDVAVAHSRSFGGSQHLYYYTDFPPRGNVIDLQFGLYSNPVYVRDLNDFQLDKIIPWIIENRCKFYKTFGTILNCPFGYLFSKDAIHNLLECSKLDPESTIIIEKLN